jgi:polyisoprenoid-binding protein YceI
MPSGPVVIGFDGSAFRGHVEMAADPNQTTVEVTIDMTSVDSGDDTRDDHLRSAELFDIANYPYRHLPRPGRGMVGRRRHPRR